MSRWILGVVAAVAVAGPASAGWSSTEWGMTKDQVIGATGGRAESAGPSQPDTLIMRGVDFAGFHFDRAYLGFDQRGLATVNLASDSLSVPELAGPIGSQLGPPVAQVGGWVFFADHAHHNSIRLNASGGGIAGGITLIYQPIPSGF